MRSDEALRAYRALSARFQVSQWVEPLGVREHLAELTGMLARGDDGPYPRAFEYDRSKITRYTADWTALREELLRAEIDDAVRPLVVAEVDDALERATALAYGSDDRYTAFEASHVGLPDSDTLVTAQAILAGNASPLPAGSGDDDGDLSVTSVEMRERMAAALAAYGLDGWVAVEDPNMTARASVNGPNRRVRIRAGATFTPRAADRLIAHEIGGHVLRWANSQAQPEEWVSVALGRTVPTEEGVAIWREVECGLQSPAQLRIYAARVVAVDAARQEGLADVARRILPHVGPQQAAEIAVRAKRGLSNPNGPGGQTKDWGYLAGLLRVSRLARENPETLRLMSGVKWSLDEGPLIQDLQRRGRVKMPILLADANRLGLTTAPG